MASTASKYLTKDKRLMNENKEFSSVKVNALIYSTSTNLVPLLIATKKGIDRLPILYLWEARA